MNRLSKITIGLGIYIIISASFMLQINDFLVKTFGVISMRLILLFLYFLAVALYVLRISHKNLSDFKIIISSFIFVLAFLFMLWLPYLAEQIHVIEYGILGFLVLKDLGRRDKRNFRNIIFVLFFIILVSSLDEGFQWILPYRYFDVRDIVTNITSGFLGIIQYLIYRGARLT